MYQVSKDQFYKTIGPLDVHPQITGNWPYVSIFRTRSREVVGKIVGSRTETGNPDQYFLVNKPSDTCETPTS